MGNQRTAKSIQKSKREKKHKVIPKTLIKGGNNMGFNLFLYAFIVWALLSAKSYDYKPSNNHEESKND